MTNPFKQFEQEYIEHDYMLPSTQQITTTDSGAIKTMMEVYRDTANHLDATEVKLAQEMSRYEELQHDFRHEKDVSENTNLELKKDIQALKEEKKFAQNTSKLLGDELADYKKRFEKIYRHRNELADMVANTRKTLTELDEWLAKHDNGEAETEPIEVLIMIAAMLHQSLKVADPKEQEGDVQ
ncbi:MAG: hypothetical protein HLX46_02615 [Corynebacterium sp.]|uniref:hypothetical protein n=1 Tax=Corynebacterium sp. TaxID=1720 RepID=UPI0017C295F0|nr:hypothetical protein [Corynebacterium sp.]NWO15743.1 hypothetical protein [Corynebacterium sp.]